MCIHLPEMFDITPATLHSKPRKGQRCSNHNSRPLKRTVFFMLQYNFKVKFKWKIAVKREHHSNKRLET